MNHANFIFFLIFLVSVSFVFAGDYNNCLSYSIADKRYCAIGSCGNATGGNTTYINNSYYYNTTNNITYYTNTTNNITNNYTVQGNHSNLTNVQGVSSPELAYHLNQSLWTYYTSIAYNIVNLTYLVNYLLNNQSGTLTGNLTVQNLKVTNNFSSGNFMEFSLTDQAPNAPLQGWVYRNNSVAQGVIAYQPLLDEFYFGHTNLNTGFYFIGDNTLVPSVSNGIHLGGDISVNQGVMEMPYNNGNWNETNFNGNITADSVFGTTNVYSGGLPVLTSETDPTFSSWYNSGNATLINLNVTGNLTVSEYIYGQPTTGMLGSGIIWTNGTNSLAEIQINCTGLVCSYNNFKVRLVNTSNDVKYCDIPNGTITATNNQHSVFYIDNNCQVQETSIQTYIQTPISPGGIADFGNVIFENGNSYDINGIGLENKRIIKLRKLLLQSTGQHLSIISGYSETEDTFPQFNISSGQYIYLMDIVLTPKKATAIDYLELLYHNSSTTWKGVDQLRFNITACDNGTGIEACTTGTGTNTKYRRHFVFMIGYNETTDTSQLHQLAPLLSVTYNSLSKCMDTITYPLQYTLPLYYQYGAVPLYAYCAQANDVSWNTNAWIDLRTVKSGSASGGSIDTTIFLLKDGTTPLTGNWNTGGYNITANQLYEGSSRVCTATNGLCPTGSSNATVNYTIVNQSIISIAFNGTLALNSSLSNYLRAENVTTFIKNTTDVNFNNMIINGNSTVSIGTTVNQYQVSIASNGANGNNYSGIQMRAGSGGFPSMRLGGIANQGAVLNTGGFSFTDDTGSILPDDANSANFGIGIAVSRLGSAVTLANYGGSGFPAMNIRNGSLLMGTIAYGGHSGSDLQINPQSHTVANNLPVITLGNVDTPGIRQSWGTKNLIDNWYDANYNSGLKGTGRIIQLYSKSADTSEIDFQTGSTPTNRITITDTGTSALTSILTNVSISGKVISRLIVNDTLELTAEKGMKFNSAAQTGAYGMHYTASSSTYPIRLALSSDSSTNRYFEVGYYASDNIASAWNSNFSVNGYYGDVYTKGNLFVGFAPAYPRAGMYQLDMRTDGAINNNLSGIRITGNLHDDRFLGTIQNEVHFNTRGFGLSADNMVLNQSVAPSYGIGIAINRTTTGLMVYNSYPNAPAITIPLNGGRVGIGTTAPNEQLVVVGNANVTGNATINGFHIDKINSTHYSLWGE